MKFLILLFVCFASTAFAETKLFCENKTFTYWHSMRAFGVPKVPMGTEIGSKSFTDTSTSPAMKDQATFYVTDPNDWTNFKDWDYQLYFSKWIVTKDNSKGDIVDLLADAEASLTRNNVAIVANQAVSCRIYYAAAPK